MVTRRCANREERLVASEETDEIFRYCLALAVQRTGVLVHAICVMSNHHHLVLTDVQGRLPDFTREFHRLTAKAMNALQNRSENLWEVGRCHLLQLAANEDVVAEIAYTIANPVRARLVASPDQWPGVLYAAREHDIVVKVRRPKAYFGDHSQAPEELELRIVPPPLIDGIEERIAASVGALVDAVMTRVAETATGFLGREAVLATSTCARPRSREPRVHQVPHVAARCIELRRAWCASRREFRRAYRAALDRWREGDRAVAFPYGTWWMRVFHGARIEGGEASAAAA